MAIITITIKCEGIRRNCGERCWGCQKAEVVTVVPNVGVEPYPEDSVETYAESERRR